MAFSESAKLNVKKKANFTCCWCLDRRNKVEVHHIVPLAEGGSDDEDNAAPLCGSCHNLYGGNPDLKKEIRQRRDQWYQICSTKQSPGHEAERLKMDRSISTVLRSVAQADSTDAVVGIRSVIETTFDFDKCFIRDRELERVIHSCYNDSVALVGDYGSGKTALLRKLQQTLDPAEWVVGYLDLAQRPIQYPSAFWQHVVIALTNSDPGETDWLGATLSLAQKITSVKRYVLCLDNIDS